MNGMVESFRRLSHRLTEPHQAVLNARQRAGARMLAGLSLALLILSILSGTLYAVLTGAGITVSLAAGLSFLSAYLLSRTRHPQWGGVLLTATTSIMIYAILPGSPDPVLGMIWIMFPILLATALLSTPAAVAAVVLNLAGMAIGGAILPGIRMVDVSMPMLVVTFASLIALVARHIRDHDVSMLENQAQELNESRERYRGLFEHVPVGLYQATPSGEILDANRACVELLGFTDRQDLLNTRIHDLCVDPERRERLYAVLERERAIRHFESRFRRADGRIIWVRESIQVACDDAGRVLSHTGNMEDITGTKLAQQELMTLASIIEQSADTIVLTDRDGNIQYANPSFERTSGYTVPEVIGQNPRLLKSGHQDEAFYHHLWETVTSGDQWTGLFVNKRKDGSLYREEATIFPVKDVLGETLGYAAIKRDVTERLQTLERLEQQNLELAVLNSLAQALAGSLQLSDLMDEALLRVSLTLGFSGGLISLLDEHTGELILGSYTGLPGQLVEGLKRGGLGGMPDYLLRSLQGPLSIADLKTDASVRFDDLASVGFCAYAGLPIIHQDRILGVLSLYDTAPHSVSESEEMLMVAIGQQIGVAIMNARLFQETQQRVRELQMLYDVGLAAALGSSMDQVLQAATEGLVEQFPDARLAMLLVDRESGVLRAQAGAGYDPDSLRNLFIPMGEGITGWVAEHGQPVLASDVSEDARYVAVAAEVRSELCVPLTVGSQVIGVLNVESPLAYALTSADQRLLSVLANTLAMSIERARLFEEVRSARAEAQRRAEELAAANERLQELDRLKSEFLANMSHELRTPLNAILGFAQLVQRSPTLPQDHRESLEIIHSSGEHLLDLINDILDMSKIEAGHTTFDPSSFDLHRMLDNLRAMISIRAEKKGLWLEIERHPDVPQTIRTDERKLRQVLINLLNNAVKFTTVGGVTLRVSCSSCDGAAAQCRLDLEVEDTGVGIDENEMGTLFHAFTQSASGRASQEGTGLGLPISRKFVEMMGGSLSVSSQVGVGSIFRFDIQAESMLEAPSGPVQPQRRAVRLQEGQPEWRILIVDDRAENRLLVRRLLEEAGFVVAEAADGRQAVRLCADWQPHLVLMDMRMPVMDGYEATRQIKASVRGQEIVVIALTASALEGERQEVLAAGCDDYVRKPFRDTEILAKLAAHLDAQYVYEDLHGRAAASDRDERDAVLSSHVLASLPPDWLLALRDAATRARGDLILDLLAQLDADHSLLAGALAHLVDEFRYDSILALLAAEKGESR